MGVRRIKAYRVFNASGVFLRSLAPESFNRRLEFRLIKAIMNFKRFCCEKSNIEFNLEAKSEKHLRKEKESTLKNSYLKLFFVSEINLLINGVFLFWKK